MIINRRQALSALVVSGGALRARGVPAQSTDQWFAITGDEGKPVRYEAGEDRVLVGDFECMCWTYLRDHRIEEEVHTPRA